MAEVSVHRKIHQISGFTLSEVIFPPRLHIPSHTHDTACFGLTLQGSMVEAFGVRPLSCTPQTVLVRPLGEAHSDHVPETGAKCLILELPEYWVSHVREQGRFMTTPEVAPPGKLTQLLKRVFGEAQRSDAATPLMIESLVFEMAAHLIRESRDRRHSHPPIWLKRVKDKLDECYAERLILAELALDAGVHSVHLARAFRQHYDVSIGEYLRRQRVQSAARDLSHGQGSLADIALRAGFSSQAHFCTVFKRVTGYSPLQFRKEKC